LPFYIWRRLLSCYITVIKYFMKEKIEHISEILWAAEKNDISLMISHFEIITNSLLILTQGLHDNREKIEHFQKELEGKFFRFGFANLSLIKLMKGNNIKINNQQISIIDIFSLNSITRMQIESYLMMFYLFFDNVDNSVKNFRYDVYKLHGLLKQSNFEIATEFLEKEIQLNKIEAEKKETLISLKNSDIYIKSNESDRQKILNPKFAKLEKSEVLFERSGINTIGINKIWQLYSNHAHSEHISDRQYNSYRNDNFSESNASLIISINTMLASRLITFLTNSFSGVRNKFQELSDKEKMHIEIWNNIGSK
jgi:hypothetical protein